MMKIVFALLIALPAAALAPEIKEALDEGCPKIARKEAKSPCAGVANVVQYMLARVGAKVDEEGHKYCVEICEKTRTGSPAK